MPVPFALWRILASGAEFLPGAPLTRNQVALMQRDNIASADCAGLPSLDIAPTEIETLSYLHFWNGVEGRNTRSVAGLTATERET